MSPDLVALLLSLGISAGLALLLRGIIGAEQRPRPDTRWQRLTRRLWYGNDRSRRGQLTRRATLLGCAAVGAAVWLYTGLPVAGIIAGVGVVGVPWLLGVGRESQRAIARLEAVEAWTRRLGDLVGVGMGLMQAITATGRTAPAAIEIEARDLVARLQSGWNPREALLQFADALDDATTDQVVAALMSHLSVRGDRLTDVLTGIADTAAADIASRQAVYAKRAEPRLVVRFLTVLTVVIVAGGFANPTYTRPYADFTGQLLLALFAAMFTGILIWIRRLGRPSRAPRLLAGHVVREN